MSKQKQTVITMRAPTIIALALAIGMAGSGQGRAQTVNPAPPPAPPFKIDPDHPNAVLDNADQVILEVNIKISNARELGGGCLDKDALAKEMARLQAAYKSLIDAAHSLVDLHEARLERVYGPNFRSYLNSGDYAKALDNLEKLIDQRMYDINDLMSHLRKRAQACEPPSDVLPVFGDLSMKPAPTPLPVVAGLPPGDQAPYRPLSPNNALPGMGTFFAMGDAEDALDDASDALDDIYDFKTGEYDGCLSPEHAQWHIDDLNAALREINAALHSVGTGQGPAEFGLGAPLPNDTVQYGVEWQKEMLGDEADEIMEAIAAIRRHICPPPGQSATGPGQQYLFGRVSLVVGAEAMLGHLTTTYDDGYKVGGAPPFFGGNVGLRFQLTPDLQIGPSLSVYGSGDTQRKDATRVSMPYLIGLEGTAEWKTPLTLPNGRMPSVSFGLGLAVGETSSGASSSYYNYSNSQTMTGLTGSLKLDVPTSGNWSVDLGVRYVNFGSQTFHSPYGSYSLKQESWMGTLGATYHFDMR